MHCSQSQIKIVQCPEHTIQFIRFGNAEYIRKELEFSDCSHIDSLKKNSHLYAPS